MVDNSKKYFISLIFLITVTLFFSGCGSYKNTETENSTSQPVSTAISETTPTAYNNDNFFEPTYTLTDTGQTKCYDNKKDIQCPKPGEAFYGQDGNYKGTQQDFIDNGETISDQGTGLVWEQVDKDHWNHLYWPDAEKYCSELDKSGSGWRMPSRSELLSIANYNLYAPSSDPKFKYNPLFKKYWASDSYGSDNLRVEWAVDFADGKSDWGNGCDTQIRCVKGNQFQKGKFRDNGDRTITDLSSGLVWQKDDNEPKTWKDALSTCESIGWKLPNIRELESITDTTNVNPWNKIFNVNAKSFMYWSSTSVAKSPGLAWVTKADLQHGGLLEIDQISKDNRIFFRCVRDASNQKNNQKKLSPQLSIKINIDSSYGGFVTSNPQGIDCGNGRTQCEALFDKGTEVSLTASENNEDWVFTGWAYGQKIALENPKKLPLLESSEEKEAKIEAKFERVLGGDSYSIYNIQYGLQDSYQFSNNQFADSVKNIKDGNAIKNWFLTKDGYCGGMSYSSIYFFNHNDKKPFDKPLSQYSMEEAGNAIVKYQLSQGSNLSFPISTSCLINSKVDSKKSYDEIKSGIQQNSPVLIHLGYCTNAVIRHFHAVVGYKIIEGRNNAELFIYDPNYPNMKRIIKYRFDNQNAYADYSVNENHIITLSPEDID